jgi:hypothetical protein
VGSADEHDADTRRRGGPPPNYGATRFNAATRRIVARRGRALGEQGGVYRPLLGALIAEHARMALPRSFWSRELAGTIWRKRRLRMAEVEKLRHEHSTPQ